MPIDEGIRGEESETRGALNLSVSIIFIRFNYLGALSKELRLKLQRRRIYAGEWIQVC